MLNTDARATAVYQAIQSSNPDFSKMSGNDDGSSGEKGALLANLKTILGADLTYLVGNTVVSTTSTIGASTIATTGGPAAQVGPSAPVNVSGSGTIG